MENEYQVQQEYVNELIRLQAENPNTRIMCFVSDECINGDYCYQSASFGKPRLEKMTLWDDIWIDDEDEIVQNISDDLYSEVGDNLSVAKFDEEVQKRFELVEWEKIIVIYIEPM